MSERAQPPDGASPSSEQPAKTTPTSAAAEPSPAVAGPGRVLQRGAAFCALLGLTLSVALLALAVARRFDTAPALALEWSAASGEAESRSAPSRSAPRLRPADSLLSADADRLLAAAAAAVERHSAELADPVLERFRGAGQARYLERPGEEIPRAERWLVTFGDGVTEGEYALQLDGLQIELAVLMPGGQIEYVSKLSLSTPVRRQGAFADEPRLYMTWQRPDLIEADRKLLAKAGLEAADKIVLHFYSAETEQKMADLELAFANRPATGVFRTRFGVRPSDATGSEFFVVEQVPRE